MSALDELKEIDLEKITPLEAAIVFLSHKHEGDAAIAAAELLALRAELTDAKERAKTAEANWHANEARIGKLESELRFIHGITMGDGNHDKVMLAKDADIFMQCIKALRLDVSGTDPEAIPAAIKRLKGSA